MVQVPPTLTEEKYMTQPTLVETDQEQHLKNVKIVQIFYVL